MATLHGWTPTQSSLHGWTPTQLLPYLTKTCYPSGPNTFPGQRHPFSLDFPNETLSSAIYFVSPFVIVLCFSVVRIFYELSLAIDA